MLSRVAESIYWMSRYIERAENLARFVDVTFNLILDQPQNAASQWEPLVFTTGDQEYFKERYGDVANRENVIEFLVFDSDYESSIISCLNRARENARTVREALSTEAWEQVNEFYHMVRGAAGYNHATTEPELFDAIREHSQLFNGILDATLSRGGGWHFANLGRLLERADKTSRILDVKYYTLLPAVQDVGTTLDDLQWSSVLRSASGFEAYRKQFHSINIHRVVEFMILDRYFPRAVHFCVHSADQSLHAISGSPLNTFKNSAEQRLGKLQSELAYSDVETIVHNGLHEFIDDLQCKLNESANAIHETFFALRPVANASSQSQFQVG